MLCSQWFVDGGLLRNIPHLPAAASAEYVVGISCTPVKYMSSLPGVAPSVAEVSPDMFEPFPWKWHEVAGLMLNAAPDELILQVSVAHTHTHTHIHTPACLPACLPLSLFCPVLTSEPGTGQSPVCML